MQRFDADQSGELSEQEFTTMMTALLDPASNLLDDQILHYQGLFQKADLDDSGTINVDELKKLLHIRRAIKNSLAIKI